MTRARRQTFADAQPEDLVIFGWPAMLTTERAVVYSGLSRRVLLAAVDKGELVRAGKRGRSFVFAKADVDAWLAGEPNEPPPAIATTRSSTRSKRAAHVDSGKALTRIRELAAATRSPRRGGGR